MNVRRLKNNINNQLHKKICNIDANNLMSISMFTGLANLANYNRTYCID